jgi:hypothetical protein
VLGKVVRAPADGTAFNAFRNSMFGATSQFAVLLSQLTDRLREFWFTSGVRQVDLCTVCVPFESGIRWILAPFHP